MRSPISHVLLLASVSLLQQTPLLRAHEVGADHQHGTGLTSVPLPFLVESKGPVRPPPFVTAPVSGQGFWTFASAQDLCPVPKAAQSHVKDAHGTLVVDTERDVLFWGLGKVGWIAYRHRLTQAEIIQGDPVFSHGNLHGADLLPRKGKLPLVAVADNVDGAVYLSDTSFAKAQQLGWPQNSPYQNQGEFHPTDVAFTQPGEIYVTDGYGKALFMPAKTVPLAYVGEYFGGKAISQTPHGITYDATTKSLLLSARPEGQIRRWSTRLKGWEETLGLPAGTTVCDLDLWGDYALAPCLDGPGNTPGPIHIVNLKKRAIVSTIRPKTELGFTEAQHIHDACWYVVGKGRQREVYIVFTYWNPGGIGALRLARHQD